MTLRKNGLNWLLFIVLSFIWGSSFILMKEGLQSLSAYQVASVRIICSGLVLAPVAVRCLHLLPRRILILIFLSGLLGSLLPAYLFCIAEQGINSSLAGTLNALTPIFTIIIAVIFFKAKPGAGKITGIAVACAGTLLLFLIQPSFEGNNNFVYMLYVVLATVLYGINVNMVHRYLAEVGSLRIAAVALGLNAIPAAIVLVATGYFERDFSDGGFQASTAFSALLGVMGTAVASVLFYVLIKRAGAVFSSMVTYGIPAVAIAWGVLYGEHVSMAEFFAVTVILFGVWIANKKTAVVKPEVAT